LTDFQNEYGLAAFAAAPLRANPLLGLPRFFVFGACSSAGSLMMPQLQNWPAGALANLLLLTKEQFARASKKPVVLHM
jgi:hypothetical protein